MHIAVGGFQHETNTFAPVRATFKTLPHPMRGLVSLVDPLS